jgi:hypothetical protein
LRGRREQIVPSAAATSTAAAGRGSVLGTSMVSMRSIGPLSSSSVPDGPLAERGDRGAFALAGGRGLPGDLAEERPDRRRGQPGDPSVITQQPGCLRRQPDRGM